MKIKSDYNTFSTFHIILTILGGALLLFIIAPLMQLLINSGPQDISTALADKEVISSLWLSIWSSCLATFVMSFFAIPLAYILARYDFPFKNIINAIIELPIVIPHSAAGIALLMILSKKSYIGSIGAKFNISFTESSLGVIIAMAFVSIPFLISTARIGFQNIPVGLEKAALTLGASPLRVFLTISIPLSYRAILSGAALMWGRGMSEFGAVIILAYHPTVTPILIFDRFSNFGLENSKAIATIFIIISLFFFFILKYLLRGPSYAKSR